jgi:tetratricopeptide (TPR) repeat protein
MFVKTLCRRIFPLLILFLLTLNSAYASIPRELREYIVFRNTKASKAMLRYPVISWNKKEKTAVIKQFQSVLKSVPGLLMRASQGRRIILYRVGPKAKIRRPTGEVLGYRPPGWANKANHALMFANGFFKRILYLGRAEYIQWYFTHELAHLADSGGKIARSRTWEMLVFSRYKKMRKLLKKNEITLLEAQRLRALSLAQQAGLVTVYAGQSMDEALAEFTAAVVLPRYSFRKNKFKMPKEIRDFIHKNMISVPKEKDESIYLVQQGLYYQLKKKMKLAIAKYSKALEIDSQYGEAYFYRGLNYFYLKQFKKALSDFNQANQYIPDYDHHAAKLYLYRAKSLVALKQLSKAKRDFQKAALLKPTEGQAYYFLAKIAAISKDYTTALMLFNRANKHLAYKSFFWRLSYLTKGRILMATGKPNQALVIYSSLIKVSPRYALAYGYRGLLYFSLKKYSLAREDLEKAIRLKPKLRKIFGVWLTKLNSLQV